MKTRLTITLSESTVRKLDQLIDKKTVRNRSHAIEQILEESLKPSIDTAIILAGGETRKNESLRPLTILDGKPLIMHTLDHLKKHGVSTVAITAGPRGTEIQDLLGDGSDYDLNIEYFFEDEPIGTAGAVRRVAESALIENDAFFVVAGDVLTTIDLDDFVAFHTQHNAQVTMAVKPRVTKASYDNVFIQGHTVVDFQRSKPSQTVSIVNAGVYIFETASLRAFPDKTPAMLERDVFPELSKSDSLLAFPFQGIWFDITSQENFEEALERMEGKDTEASEDNKTVATS